MYHPRKHPNLPHEQSLEIPRGWRVPKAKTFKGKYEAKLEFPDGWGVQTQKQSMGEVCYTLYYMQALDEKLIILLMGTVLWLF